MVTFIVTLMIGQSLAPRPKPDYLLPYTPPPPKPANEIPHHAPASEPKPTPVQSTPPQIDPKTFSQTVASEVAQQVMATQSQLQESVVKTQESVARTQAAIAELTKSVATLADMQVLSNAKNNAQKSDPMISKGARGEPVRVGNQYAAADSRGQWWYDDAPEKVTYAVEYYNRRISGIPVRQATTTYESAAYQAAPPVQGPQTAPYAAPGAAPSGAACYSSGPPATSYAAPPTSYAAPPMTYAAPATASTSCYSGAPATTSYAAPMETYAAMPSYGAPASFAAPASQVEVYRRGLFGRERRILFNGPAASGMRASMGLFGASVCGPFGCP